MKTLFEKITEHIAANNPEALLAMITYENIAEKHKEEHAIKLADSLIGWQIPLSGGKLTIENAAVLRLELIELYKGTIHQKRNR